jgi:hypothetical protein
LALSQRGPVVKRGNGERGRRNDVETHHIAARPAVVRVRQQVFAATFWLLADRIRQLPNPRQCLAHEQVAQDAGAESG